MLLPVKIYAGDKLEFTETNSNFLSTGGWTAKYILINLSHKITFNSVPDGSGGHLFSIPSATTSPWNAGLYTAQLYFEHTSGTKDGIERRSINIEPDLITAETYDTRTQNRRTYDSICDLLEGKFEGDAASISLSFPNGSSRTLQKITPAELLDAKNHYAKLVNAEERAQKLANGEKPGGRMFIRLTN